MEGLTLDAHREIDALLTYRSTVTPTALSTPSNLEQALLPAKEARRVTRNFYSVIALVFPTVPPCPQSPFKRLFSSAPVLRHPFSLTVMIRFSAANRAGLPGRGAGDLHQLSRGSTCNLPTEKVRCNEVPWEGRLGRRFMLSQPLSWGTGFLPRM